MPGATFLSLLIGPMATKYELLVDDTVQQDGRSLSRVRRLSDGLLGGYIETQDNLAQSGGCFLFEKSRAFGNSRIRDDAELYGMVYGEAVLAGNAKVFGEVFGQARVLDHAIVRGRVYDQALVKDSAEVYGQAYGRSVVEDHAKVYGQIYGTAKASDHEVVFGSKSR
jgi:hypothetical protein